MLYPVGNYFGENFVGDIAKGDGTKAIKGVYIFVFGDQCQEGSIGGSSYIACQLDISNHAEKVLSDDFPTLSIEVRSKSIQPGCFIWIEVEYYHSNFFFSDCLYQSMIVLVCYQMWDHLHELQPLIFIIFSIPSIESFEMRRGFIFYLVKGVNYLP